MENCSQIQIKSIEKASHTLKKLSAALLAFIMLFAAACKFGDIDFDVTKAPQQQTQEPTQEPTHEKTAADEAFEAVDREVFISVVTSSGLTFHQFVKDAASFGIAEEDIERGWGELSQGLMLPILRKTPKYAKSFPKSTEVSYPTGTESHTTTLFLI